MSLYINANITMIPKNCHKVTFHLIIVPITTFISPAICNLLFASRMCPLFQMERWLVWTGAQTKRLLSLFFYITPPGKIALHLLFGWRLDKDKKSLDQSKQFSWKFGSIQIKAIPNPDHPPLGIFWTYHFFCTKHKIIENEKWKLLHTLIVALELSLSKDIR